jgi:biopolymer transport protein ExbD
MPIKIHRSRSLSAIPMTPLIDVVFLLLTFFLVATQLAEEDHQLDVKLPNASNARPMIETRDEIYLSLDADGACYVEGTQIDKNQLSDRLREICRDQPATSTAILRADSRCDWDDVVRAIDACHQAGLKDVRPTVRGDAAQ